MAIIIIVHRRPYSCLLYNHLYSLLHFITNTAQTTLTALLLFANMEVATAQGDYQATRSYFTDG